MRVGPQRSRNEPFSAFRYRQALYYWPWTWALAPVLATAILVLRLAHGPLWKGALLVALLSGTALGVTAAAGAAFSLASRWAALRERRETDARRWPWAGFAISTALLAPAWLWSFYWTVLAMMRQHIVYGRWDNVVALSVEPQRFLLSLTAHAAMLITIPVYWMAQASKHSLPPTSGDTPYIPGDVLLPGEAHTPLPRRHLRGWDADDG